MRGRRRVSTVQPQHLLLAEFSKGFRQYSLSWSGLVPVFPSIFFIIVWANSGLPLKRGPRGCPQSSESVCPSLRRYSPVALVGAALLLGWHSPFLPRSRGSAQGQAVHTCVSIQLSLLILQCWQEICSSWSVWVDVGQVEITIWFVYPIDTCSPSAEQRQLTDFGGCQGARSQDHFHPAKASCLQRGGCCHLGATRGSKGPPPS